MHLLTAARSITLPSIPWYTSTKDIADLRACKVRELEEKRVNKEMAHIRQKFKGGRGFHTDVRP
jgi:hypothetical protein